MPRTPCHELASRLLDPDPEVEQHLSECPGCQRRANFARSLAGRIRQAEYEPPLPEGLVARLATRLDRVPQPATRRTWSRPLAGGLALAAALVIAFFLWGRPPADELVADMVRHHEGCFHLQNTPGKTEQFQKWVAAHAGKEIPLPRGWPANLAPVDRRDCPVAEGARGPHLMYVHAGGEQVSLYALPRADLKGIKTRSENPTSHRYEGYNVLVWEREGWLYGVVARLDEPEMRGWVALRAELQAWTARRQSIDDHVPIQPRAFRTGGAGSRRSALPLRAPPL